MSNYRFTDLAPAVDAGRAARVRPSHAALMRMAGRYPSFTLEQAQEWLAGEFSPSRARTAVNELFKAGVIQLVPRYEDWLENRDGHKITTYEARRDV